MTDTIINPIFNYEDLPDEDVIGKVQQGDNNALNYIINKYYDLVNMKTNKFFIVGAEKSDIIQECLIFKSKIRLKHLQICVLRDKL